MSDLDIIAARLRKGMCSPTRIGECQTCMDTREALDAVERLRAMLGPASELDAAIAALVDVALSVDETWGSTVPRLTDACHAVRFARIRADVAAGNPCPRARSLSWSDLPCEFCGKGHGPASRGEVKP